MELQAEVEIGAPASVAWVVLGERFGQIGEWATPIIASSLEGEPVIGAVRTCRIAGFGPVAPGVIKERLIAFAPERTSLVYEAIDGMPRFVRRSVNRWSVHARDERTCAVRAHATVELSRLATVLSPLLKRKLQHDGARVLEELRFRIEHGHPHPRKVDAVADADRPCHTAGPSGL
jgi:hypothetical protein